jgi:hypothetical protein
MLYGSALYGSANAAIFTGMNGLNSYVNSQTSQNYGTTSSNPCGPLQATAAAQVSSEAARLNLLDTQITNPSSQSCLSGAFSSFSQIGSMLSSMSTSSIIGSLENSISSMGSSMASNLESQACGAVNNSVGQATGGFTGNIQNIMTTPSNQLNQLGGSLTNAVGGQMSNVTSPISNTIGNTVNSANPSNYIPPAGNIIQGLTQPNSSSSSGSSSGVVGALRGIL